LIKAHPNGFSLELYFQGKGATRGFLDNNSAIIFAHDDFSKSVNEIIGPLLGAPVNFLTGNDNPPIGESSLLREGMRLIIPSNIDQLGQDIFTAGIGFVTHLLFHGSQSYKSPPGRSELKISFNE